MKQFVHEAIDNTVRHWELVTRPMRAGPVRPPDFDSMYMMRLFIAVVLLEMWGRWEGPVLAEAVCKRSVLQYAGHGANATATR